MPHSIITLESPSSIKRERSTCSVRKSKQRLLHESIATSSTEQSSNTRSIRHNDTNMNRMTNVDPSKSIAMQQQRKKLISSSTVLNTVDTNRPTSDRKHLNFSGKRSPMMKKKMKQSLLDRTISKVDGSIRKQQQLLARNSAMNDVSSSNGSFCSSSTAGSSSDSGRLCFKKNAMVETPIVPLHLKGSNHSLFINNSTRTVLGKSNPSLDIIGERVPDDAVRFEIANMPTLMFQVPGKEHSVNLNGKKLEVDSDSWYPLPNSGEPLEFNLDGSPSKNNAYNVHPLNIKEAILRGNNDSNNLMSRFAVKESTKNVRIGDDMMLSLFKNIEEKECAEKRVLELETKIKELSSEIKRSRRQIACIRDGISVYCPICLGLIQNAMIVSCKGGHAVCKQCHDDFFKNKLNDMPKLRSKRSKVVGECPSCREEILNTLSQKSDVVNQNVLTFVKAGLVTDARDVEVYLNSKAGPSLNEEEKWNIMKLYGLNSITDFMHTQTSDKSGRQQLKD